ncbi:MAG TPA: DJ-1/PfpI family protein [Thermoanaerobaculia bacterium]|nr:DJ-1/PfpI family protein [Thermoanaerobaculia bacterium]
MKRRDFLKTSAGLGLWAATPGAARRALATAMPSGFDGPQPASPLKAPAQGSIPVAFLISDGAVVIDFCGPWEVFQDAAVPGRMDNPFQLYTVAATGKPVRTSAGMKIVPEYTFQSAPPPKVVVIPAQGDKSEAPIAWLRKTAQSADVIMSVCTGAFLLARTGLLDGKAATTHHSGFRQFAMDFPKIQLQRGARYVDNGSLATAGGLSSGIDLALHVVERYFGREAAENTAYYMEYQGAGWKNPQSNAVYATARLSTSEHPLCAVCEMDVDPKTAPKSAYKGRTYYFCSDDHKKQFDATPASYAQATTK